MDKTMAWIKQWHEQNNGMDKTMAWIKQRHG